MHPEFARTLAAQRHEELRHMAEACRVPARRRLPGLHLSWSRLASRTGSSLVIVISAHRA